MTNPRTRANHWRPLALTCCLLLLSSGWAHALPEDREKPIHIESDRAEHNQRQGVTIYAGSVKLTQGTLLITADQITIHTNDDSEVAQVLAEGTPAHFEQQPNEGEPLMVAEGEAIRYRADAGTVRLSGNAKLTQEGSTMTGDRIDYNLDDETVQAQGDPDSERPRIEMVIPPQNNDNRD